MPNIPFSSQILPPDHLAFVQMSIKAGNLVAGNDLLLAIEQSIRQSLPQEIRDLVRRALIPAVKIRGRPAKFGASLDLALEKVDWRYPVLLRHEKQKKGPFPEERQDGLKGRISLVARVREAAPTYERCIWSHDPGSTQEQAFGVENRSLPFRGEPRRFRRLRRRNRAVVSCRAGIIIIQADFTGLHFDERKGLLRAPQTPTIWEPL
jgi:hypothetical protein